VAFLSIESLACSLSCCSKGNNPPLASTRSRHFGESPATFPRAHTACKHKQQRKQQAKHQSTPSFRVRIILLLIFHACSRTSSLGELRSLTKMGTAPHSTTTLVFSDVPDAMLVSAQAASNCNKKTPTVNIASKHASAQEKQKMM
jgi:hypothetical protein